MNRIIYLTFYFKPDLCAGAFRNSPLALELVTHAKSKDCLIDVYTTLPNRYSTFVADALDYEEFENLRIHRISLPAHKSGMLDQVLSFWKFYKEVIKLNKRKKASLVFASSSRLFTAFLGYRLASKLKAPLYLDIRDIFVDTMNDVFKSKTLKLMVLPFLRYIESKTFHYATHINLISGGFKDYFKKFNKANFSYYSNGIDEEFLQKQSEEILYNPSKAKKLVVYAGNIGEGQGLHKIIPSAAKKLENDFQFLIIGDGGTKKLLQSEIDRLAVNNVVLKNPINRNELQKMYNNADFLFLHLNDYPAFRKVLPSKIFELATFNKPIIAGVAGYSAEFIKNEVSDSFVFEPCNVDALVNYLSFAREEANINRGDFINKFTRRRINQEMAESILSYL
jgi:UDP-N-acetylglucosamine:LPS N-acetylglucosamine transferase